jgi:hypothetical protein
LQIERELSPEQWQLQQLSFHTAGTRQEGDVGKVWWHFQQERRKPHSRFLLDKRQYFDRRPLTRYHRDFSEAQGSRSRDVGSS